MRICRAALLVTRGCLSFMLLGVTFALACLAIIPVAAFAFLAWLVWPMGEESHGTLEGARQTLDKIKAEMGDGRTERAEWRH